VNSAYYVVGIESASIAVTLIVCVPTSARLLVAHETIPSAKDATEEPVSVIEKSLV
jgi:hypothetical protein